MTTVGLRERKKSQTRQVIADTAMDLFRRHGYDAVTVEQVAAAAQVSKKTVFNYFTTKEDLVFARADDREAAIVAAATSAGGSDGNDLLESFRVMCLDQTAFIARMRTEPSRGLFDLIAANPPLQRRAHEIHARLTSVLVAILARQTGLATDDPLLEVVAGTLVNAQRALYRTLRERVARGGTDAAITRAHRTDVDRVFDHLRAGFGTLPRP